MADRRRTERGNQREAGRELAGRERAGPLRFAPPLSGPLPLSGHPFISGALSGPLSGSLSVWISLCLETSSFSFSLSVCPTRSLRDSLCVRCLPVSFSLWLSLSTWRSLFLAISVCLAVSLSLSDSRPLSGCISLVGALCLAPGLTLWLSVWCSFCLALSVGPGARQAERERANQRENSQREQEVS